MTVQSLAVCWDYASLMGALRARRVALGFTQLEVDERAGLQDGYTGKLEAWDKDSGRRLGPVSLPLLLGALEVQLALVVLRESRPRAVPDPRQMILPLVGGDMNRHHDGEFVRLPGRNRRRADGGAGARDGAPAACELLIGGSGRPGASKVLTVEEDNSGTSMIARSI